MFRSGFKMKMFIIILLLAVAMFSVSPVFGATEEKIGVLVVAHGSNEDWNQAVQEEVEQVKLPYPVELVFLESVERDINSVVKELEEEGVNKIIAVPLFICSYSNHMEEIKCILGLRDTLPEEEDELTPVNTQAEIVLTPALDDHVIVAGILAERLKTISQDPGQEIAVLVGHGSSAVEGHQKWCANLDSLAGQLKNLLDLKDVHYGFVGVGEPTVRDTVSQAVYQGNVLVVPVMLSEGYFTGTKIPKALDGLEYRYPEPGNRALIPHANISRFIELRVNDVVLPPLQIKKDGDLCQINYTGVALEPDGKICVCGSFVFRAMQIAFNELWKNDVPQQNEIKAIAHQPTDGTEDALDIIAGPGNFTIQGTVENAVYATPDNYTYLVNNKITGQTLKITARPEIFPENFFDLRARIKNQTATGEEKKQFQELRSQVVEKLRWEPAEELFVWRLNEDPRCGDGGGNSIASKSEQTVKAVLQGKELKISLDKGNLNLPAGILPAETEIAIKPWIKNELPGKKILVAYEITATSAKKEAITTGNEKYTVTLQVPAGLKQVGVYYLDPVFDTYIPVQSAYDTGSGEVKASLKHFLPFIAVEEEPVKIADLKPGAWYQEVVERCTAKNLIPLSYEDNFKPEDGLSRELAARAIALAANVPGIKEDSSFQDARTSPFVTYINSAAKTGLIKGYPGGSFKPAQTVTRSEWLALILRTLGEENNGSNAPSSPDLTGHWAAGIFARGYELGLVKGYPDGNMRPAQSVTRAEAASILMRAFSF